MSALDVLDLSPEALAWKKSTETGTETTETERSEATSDVSLQSPDMTEAERVELIRVNKNAVLDRVNSILAEKGVEVSENQAFDLKVNFLDGSVSVTGVEDEALAAAMNEALAGDEELIALMRKTRDELGLPEQENTVPRNFTIEFNSMLETPADAELEFKIDLFVNRSVPQLEDGTAAVEETEDDETQTEITPTFQMSIVLSNRVQSSLLDQLENKTTTKDAEKKDKSAKAENVEDEDDTEEAEETVAIAAEEVVENDTDVEDNYSIFGNWFRTDSTVTATPEGLLLDWNLQFRNWDMSGNLDNPAADQRIFETLNLGGTMQFDFDSTTGLSPTEQAAQLQSLFSGAMNQYFSQGTTSTWGTDFFGQTGLDQLGLIPS